MFKALGSGLAPGRWEGLDRVSVVGRKQGDRAEDMRSIKEEETADLWGRETQVAVMASIVPLASGSFEAWRERPWENP